jgi:hypothetical protein
MKVEPYLTSLYMSRHDTCVHTCIMPSDSESHSATMLGASGPGVFKNTMPCLQYSGQNLSQTMKLVVTVFQRNTKASTRTCAWARDKRVPYLAWARDKRVPYLAWARDKRVPYLVPACCHVFYAHHACCLLYLDSFVGFLVVFLECKTCAHSRFSSQGSLYSQSRQNHKRYSFLECLPPKGLLFRARQSPICLTVSAAESCQSLLKALHASTLVCGQAHANM